MSTLAKILIGLGAMFAGCSGLVIVGAAVTANGAAEIQKLKTEKLAAAATTLPWVGEVQANCSAYRAAPNEIKKSEIFRSNKSTLESATVDGARGKLLRLSTNQGGSELGLGIELNGVLFSAGGIDRGSAVYEAASSMTEGQCVTFSANKIHSSSLLEQSKVCDLEYSANVTSLAACP